MNIKKSMLTVILSAMTMAGWCEETSAGFARCMLLEEFTTEKCSNCPPVARFVEAAENDARYKGRINIVGHHAGFETDWLTTEWDKEYVWFYNNGGYTFAPALMFDRRPYTWKLVSTPSPCYYPYTNADLCNKLDECLAASAPVTVNVEARREGDNVSVTVSGLVDHAILNEGDETAVTVFLVESGVKARYQSGAGSNYVHRSVNRAVNATWGEAIDLGGDCYEYECELPLSDQWNWDNISVVAAVHRVDFDDPCAWEVYNSGSLDFAEFCTNTVKGIDGDPAIGREYYTLQGIRIEKPGKGLFIERHGNVSRKVWL